MNEKKQRLKQELERTFNLENPHTDNYLIPDDWSKKVRSLMSIKSDLGDAHAALTELSVMLLMNTGEETIRTALWKSAIVTYGKCFANSDDGQSKLEVKDCFTGHEYYIGVHNSLISVRNGFIAHQGDNEFEDTVLFMQKDKNLPDETTYSMKSFRASISSFQDLTHYLNVIEILQKFVESRIEKQLQKIHDHLHGDSKVE